MMDDFSSLCGSRCIALFSGWYGRCRVRWLRGKTNMERLGADVDN